MSFNFEIRVILAITKHKRINATISYIDVNDVKLANAVEVVVV